jgi:hypothetical protein
MSDTKKFYYEGWNAYVHGDPYNPFAKKDWRQGWRDCKWAPKEDRVEMK